MFATVIMKYFIAICTCILLLCSFNSTNKGGIIRECPPEVISSISMLSDDTNSYRQLSTEKRYDAPNVKLSEVNLLCFTLRTRCLPKHQNPYLQSKYFAITVFFYLNKNLIAYILALIM